MEFLEDLILLFSKSKNGKPAEIDGFALELSKVFAKPLNPRLFLLSNCVTSGDVAPALGNEPPYNDPKSSGDRAGVVPESPQLLLLCAFTHMHSPPCIRGKDK